MRKKQSIRRTPGSVAAGSQRMGPSLCWRWFGNTSADPAGVATCAKQPQRRKESCQRIPRRFAEAAAARDRCEHGARLRDGARLSELHRHVRPLKRRRILVIIIEHDLRKGKSTAPSEVSTVL